MIRVVKMDESVVRNKSESEEETDTRSTDTLNVTWRLNSTNIWSPQARKRRKIESEEDDGIKSLLFRSIVRQQYVIIISFLILASNLSVWNKDLWKSVMVSKEVVSEKVNNQVNVSILSL